MNSVAPAVPVIAMDEVVSSQIHSLGYDSASSTMAVRFKNKASQPTSLYHYASVPFEAFSDLVTAESIGSHFYKNIKPYPELYPYTCIEKLPPAPADEVSK
jgi:hypothetical protein